MKLTELLEQCESDASSVCLSANQRLRYHAAHVLPGLIHRLKVISEGKAVFGVDDMRRIAAEGVKIAEEVEDHSQQSTPATKTTDSYDVRNDAMRQDYERAIDQSARQPSWDFNDQETFQP